MYRLGWENVSLTQVVCGRKANLHESSVLCFYFTVWLWVGRDRAPLQDGH